MRWKISRETRFPGLLTLATNDNFRDERVYRMQIANTWRKRASTIRLGVFFSRQSSSNERIGDYLLVT